MSAQLLFEVTHQIINRVDTFKPVADSRNYLIAHFNFLTDEWTDIITVVFTKGDMSYKVLLDNNNECLVPWELLVEGGDIYVSCYCNNLVTATSSRITVVDSGYVEDAENTEPPTPNIYDQIISKFNELKEDLTIIDGGSFTDWNEEG